MSECPLCNCDPCECEEIPKYVLCEECERFPCECNKKHKHKDDDEDDDEDEDDE